MTEPDGIMQVREEAIRGKAGKGKAIIKRKTEAASAPQEAAETTAKPGRGRSRRKGQANEVETPMEATISAEHLTREEIVEAQPEPAKRGKGRAPRRREKRMEIEAPTGVSAHADRAVIIVGVAVAIGAT